MAKKLNTVLISNKGFSMNKITLLIVFIFSHHTLAGNEVGNGGDVVVCNTGTQLLDYYEASSLGLKLGANSQVNFKQEVKNQLDAFAKIDKKTADQYQKRFTSILEEIEFKKNIALSNIPDSSHEALPAGCSLKQIAIRRSESSLKKLFLVDKTLWESLDDKNKAGLILHEIIYEHFFFLGEKNSKKARFMTTLLAHIQTGKPLPKSYKSLLQEMKIPIYR